MTLAEASIGDHAVVVGVAAAPDGGSAHRRLLDLGFVPGTPVSVQRRAPLGDPTVYSLRGSSIALRKSAARLVEVVLTDNSATIAGDSFVTAGGSQ